MFFGAVVQIAGARSPSLEGSGREYRRSAEACFDNLDRYVELELAGRDAESKLAGFKAHLDGCPACREEYESLRTLVGGDQVL